jgi:DNA repair protein RecO (recombination protein O)
MIVKTRAIVLHQIKYAETSIIATLYTEELGRQAYLINGIRSAKSKQRTSLFQSLTLLETEVYHKPGRELQRMKEFRLGQIHQSIPFDMGKSAVSMLLSEILYKTLRSEEADQSLFDFIWQAIIYFDSMGQGASNFHLWFLVKIAAYLGFKLENNLSVTNKWFDLKGGCFVGTRPQFINTPNIEESAHIAGFIDMPAHQVHLCSLNGAMRSRLLEIIIEYYAIHFDAMGTINSLKVLRELYH